MDLIKNIEKSKVFALKDLIDYEDNKVASLTLANKAGVGITLMAFDAGEAINTHSAGGDAMVVILEGDVEITIDGILHILHEGETVVMPANIPHGLKSITRFKMLLTVVFPEKQA